jgi:hypothetical protein
MLMDEMFGDPAATANAIFRAVDADKRPRHLVLEAAATFFIPPCVSVVCDTTGD